MDVECDRDVWEEVDCKDNKEKLLKDKIRHFVYCVWCVQRDWAHTHYMHTVYIKRRLIDK